MVGQFHLADYKGPTPRLPSTQNYLLQSYLCMVNFISGPIYHLKLPINLQTYVLDPHIVLTKPTLHSLSVGHQVMFSV